MRRKSFCVAFVVLACSQTFAESSESAQGFTFYERFQGSFNSLGAVTRLDTTVGYILDSHFSVAGGIPVYFVRPSDSTAAFTGVHAANGIGNVYGQFRLTLSNPVVNYASTVTVYAPTGDQATGFSTGHVTADWSNYFERTFSKTTPFAELGIANSVSDTLFFIRPYTTLGFVTHWQGGVRYRLARAMNVGGSIYGIEPSGQQTVLSRLVQASNSVPAAGRSNGSGNSRVPVIQTSSTTTGPADIARDHGFSTWLQVSPASHVDFYVGYTHSTRYSLNTLFVGAGVNLGRILRRSDM